MFRFKQFSVSQPEGVFKTGTDSILLGALSEPPTPPRRILDIGTGNGILSLMIAQRFPDSVIVACDENQRAADAAKRNFQNSSFSNRLNVIHADYNALTPSNAFDMIICNPPFFTSGEHSKTLSSARHEGVFSMKNFWKKASELTSIHTSVHLIIPAGREKEIVSAAGHYGFSLHKITRFKHDEKSRVKRVLTEFTARPITRQVAQSFIISDENGDFSAQYRKVTSAFHPFL